MGSSWTLVMTLAAAPPETAAVAPALESSEAEAPPNEEAADPPEAGEAARPEGPAPLPEAAEDLWSNALPSELGVESVVDDPAADDEGPPQLQLDPTPRDLRPPNWAIGWVGPKIALVLRPLDYRTELGDSGLTALNRQGQRRALLRDEPALMPLTGGVGPVDTTGFDPGGAGVSLTLSWRLRKPRAGENPALVPRMGLFVSLQAQSGGVPEQMLPPSMHGAASPVGAAATAGIYIRF